jgi:hypothetical protein
MPSPEESSRVSLDMCNFFECECGSKVFRPTQNVHIVYNRLRVKETGILPIQQLECVKCQSPVVFDEDGEKRLEAHRAKKSGEKQGGVIHGS